VKCNLFTIFFLALKVINIPWMHMHKISFINFQWGIDESSSMTPRLLEGTSLGYEHPKNICGSHGLQQ
jgi:hypothetical protein